MPNARKHPCGRCGTHLTQPGYCRDCRSVDRDLIRKWDKENRA